MKKQLIEMDIVELALGFSLIIQKAQIWSNVHKNAVPPPNIAVLQETHILIEDITRDLVFVEWLYDDAGKIRRTLRSMSFIEGNAPNNREGTIAKIMDRLHNLSCLCQVVRKIALTCPTEAEPVFVSIDNKRHDIVDFIFQSFNV